MLPFISVCVCVSVFAKTNLFIWHLKTEKAGVQEGKQRHQDYKQWWERYLDVKVAIPQSQSAPITNAEINLTVKVIVIIPCY